MNRPLRLFALLLLASPALAQDVPQTLEDMISLGLKSNPDVLLAEAKMRQAEAEMLQARLKVTREIVELWNTRRKKLFAVQEMQAVLKETSQLTDKGMAPAGELRKAQTAFQLAEAELSEFNVTLRPLLGIGLMRDAGRGATQAQEPTTIPRPPWPEPEDDVLVKSKVTLDLEDVEVVDAFREVLAKSNVNLSVERDLKDQLSETKVTLKLKDVTPRAAIEAITDQVRIALVLRDYGYFLTTADRAGSIKAPTLPTTLPLFE